MTHSDRLYSTGKRISDQQLSAVHLEPNSWQGHWNYSIHPVPS
ncbi:MAG: hypothetical protein GY803_26270 [Chloroflexi bacterium]|nr:hypothetical protein [Chloroflexota bacterium]